MSKVKQPKAPPAERPAAEVACPVDGHRSPVSERVCPVCGSALPTKASGK